MTGYWLVFAAFFALGAARAIQQRLPRRSIVAAEPVTITWSAAPLVPLNVSPDEAACRARALFEGDEITVEDYEAELDRLIAMGARLR